MKYIHQVMVQITVDTADKDDVRSYVESAVREMGGSHETDSPFFGLEQSDVKAQYVGIFYCFPEAK